LNCEESIAVEIEGDGGRKGRLGDEEVDGWMKEEGGADEVGD